MMIQGLTHIEVETSTYCNRSCAWCPNHFTNRGQEHLFMSDFVWNKLLSELSSYDYSYRFAFHNYNEPLYDINIFQRIQSAREAIPNAHLVLYTNGDKLNESMLYQLLELGLDEVRVTIYPKNNDITFTQDIVNKKFQRFMKKINASGTVCLEELKVLRSESEIEYFFKFENMMLRLVFPNVEMYNYRAGSVPIQIVKKAVRREACFRPFHSASIDYLGNLKLCCQIYDTTNANNQPYVIGNLNDYSFAELWHSQKMQLLRQNIQETNFDAVPVCKNCTAHTPRDIIQNNYLVNS